MFADFIRLLRRNERSSEVVDLKKTGACRIYFPALAFLLLSLLWVNLRLVQPVYGVTGALFMAFAALTLLILNGRARLVGREFRSSWVVSLLLVMTLAFFSFLGIHESLAAIG